MIHATTPTTKLTGMEMSVAGSAAIDPTPTPTINATMGNPDAADTDTGPEPVTVVVPGGPAFVALVPVYLTFLLGGGTGDPDLTMPMSAQFQNSSGAAALPPHVPICESIFQLLGKLGGLHEFAVT
jgi:hypothetical protein